MKRPTQPLKVGVIIGSVMALRFDMVNRGRGYRSTFTQSGLAQVLITVNDGPLATVGSFMAALALLMVLPASIAVFMHRSVVVLRQPCLRLALGISFGIHPQ